MAKLRIKKKRNEALAREESKKVTIQHRGGPWTGVKFPEGTKRIVFMAYVHNGGNIRATIRELKEAKAIPDGRVPTHKTITLWAHDGHWEVLKNMVDEGLMDFLEAQEDPDIKNAIREDATLFKFLLSLRSTIYIKMGAKNSPLMPRNTSDAVRLLQHIQQSMETYQSRTKGVQDRREVAGIPSDATSEDVPDNVISVAQKLAEKGIPVTQEGIAREMLRIKEEKAN